MEIRKAQKAKSKIRLGIAGPSGSGKTYSSLILASGITSLEKVCIIDTEHGSADLYESLGGYNVLRLDPPYSPERYIEAIRTAEQAGMEVIIIDSMSHEWDGRGGIIEIHDSMPGNSFTNWAKVTPRHNAFIEAILASKAHIVATLRSKQDYVLVEKNGKQVPEKVGLKAITREGVEYEFTLFFDLNVKHIAVSTKDRTSLFMDKPEFTITPDTGKIIKAWAESGIDVPVKEQVTETRPTPQTQAHATDSVMRCAGCGSTNKYHAPTCSVVHKPKPEYKQEVSTTKDALNDYHDQKFQGGDVCVDCKRSITKPVKEYSQKSYGLSLCMVCQKKHQKLPVSG